MKVCPWPISSSSISASFAELVGGYADGHAGAAPVDGRFGDGDAAGVVVAVVAVAPLEVGDAGKPAGETTEVARVFDAFLDAGVLVAGGGSLGLVQLDCEVVVFGELFEMAEEVGVDRAELAFVSWRRVEAVGMRGHGDDEAGVAGRQLVEQLEGEAVLEVTRGRRRSTGRSGGRQA